jgi:Holliday junction DNA helicase RuvA
MIDFLRGTIVHIEEDYIVMDVHGVGYRIYCANPYLFHNELEKECTVFIHHYVREDAILLYGFRQRNEQALFRRLLEVSGIGPKMALGILSAGPPETVVSAIQQENVVFLSKLPGIGKKTAQRIILDLKDKLDAVQLPPAHVSPADAAGQRDDSFVPAGSVWNEAKEALKALGITDAEWMRVQQKLLRQHAEPGSVNAAIKLALQTLDKG